MSSVNSSLPPPSKPLPPAPSLLQWIAIAFVIGLAGAFGMLVIWPKSSSTTTPIFWITTIGMPANLAALVVLLRFRNHAGLCREAVTWDAVRNDYINLVDDGRRRPMCVLGSSFRFSSNDEENAVENIAFGQVRLTPRLLPSGDGVINSRWLYPDENETGYATFGRDSDRQSLVLCRLLKLLLEPLDPAIKALPQTLDLRVALYLVCPNLKDAGCDVFHKTWSGLDLPEPTIISYAPVSLMSIEKWLDDASKDKQHVTLVIAIELRSLYSKALPDKSAEVGTAILLTPETVVTSYRLDPEAYVHRPIRGPIPMMPMTLQTALSQAKLEAASIGNLWHSGFHSYIQDSFLKYAGEAGVPLMSEQSSNEHDLDRIVGRSGIAADWLALACACEFSHYMGKPQFVSRFDGSHSVMCVVRPVERSHAYASL